MAPQDPELLALAGEIAIENKDFAKATEYYEKASALAPQTARYHMGLGLSSLGRGQNDSAVSQFQMAASLDTKSPQADILLIMTQIRHAKLWLAGDVGNWDLADYQIDELKEGLEYAVKYVPT